MLSDVGPVLPPSDHLPGVVLEIGTGVRTGIYFPKFIEKTGWDLPFGTQQPTPEAATSYRQPHSLKSLIANVLKLALPGIPIEVGEKPVDNPKTVVYSQR